MEHNKLSVIQLLKEREASQPIDENVDHPVDDFKLMETWSLGKLSSEKLDKIVTHLADCVYCRRETSSMIKEGILLYSPRAERTWWNWLKKQAKNPLPITVAALLLISLTSYSVYQQSHNDLPKFKILNLREFETTLSADDTVDVRVKTNVSNSYAEKEFEKATNLMHKQEFDEAMTIFNKLEKRYPNNAAISNAQGIILYLKNDKEAAKEKLNRSLELNPDPQIKRNLEDF